MEEETARDGIATREDSPAPPPLKHGADGWETEICQQWMAEAEQQSYLHHEYEYHFFVSFLAAIFLSCRLQENIA